ncbi:uncharacterized protein AMSG_01499 [Thecamonas trahens ATCC 50062]|uniref:Uncharacterized protein n=1 Tax=Thecamonas trahens ATCC 50062 TaxID=461836 RepID=A0A0L0DRL2_THETB|nr:hypothetical protein AMSG_01499 [Thecamonas trahens ATCC 50062]KNC54646.1 hypothetical protein AMSG_01499 [Thecamonas trahens ATCC 50062]|eukprot:XP_013761551.1 hypothetical protein AMSG_01499 [Thecamonas trahens ATCC 50062]
MGKKSKAGSKGGAAGKGGGSKAAGGDGASGKGTASEAGSDGPPRVVFLKDATFVRPAASVMLVLAVMSAGVAGYRFLHGADDGSEMPTGLKLWHGSDLVVAFPTALCGLGLYGFDRKAVILTRKLFYYFAVVVPAVALILAADDALDRRTLELLALRIGFWAAAAWYTEQFEQKIKGLKEL